MAIPNKTDLYEMEFTYLGEPFVSTTAKSAIDPYEMEHTYLGEPFVSNLTAVTVTSNIKAVNSVTYANLKAVNGVAIASIKAINGIT